MLSSPLPTSSSTMIDDRTLRAYLNHSTAWNLDEHDHVNLSSSSNNGEKFLNSSIHLPTEMRSANLDQMVSNIVDERGEFQDPNLFSSVYPYLTRRIDNESIDQHLQYIQRLKSNRSQQMRIHSSPFSESGHPRNIPDLCSMNPNPPKDIQVLIRQGDRTGINSLIKHVSLQQFRQMIGLQRSSGLTAVNERKTRHTNVNSQPVSSSSSSSSSFSAANIRLVNTIKQKEMKKTNQQWPQELNPNKVMLPQQHQQIYSRPHSSMLSHETMSSSITDTNLPSPVTTCQEIRRTGVANTLHIAIEKCYEQLNYIRDSYAETESKLGIQTLHKSNSASANDATNTNLLGLSNNPSRVDRLIAEYHHEHSRVIHLHEQIKDTLSIQNIEATRETLDEWLNAIHIVQDRRRQEIENATEKCRSGEPRLPDEKDVLQLAEALRILRITTRKIRTVLWYWLYWSINSTTNKIPLLARYRNDCKSYNIYDGVYSIISDDKSDTEFYSSIQNDLCDLVESNEQRMISLKKKSISSLNEHNKENEYNE